MDESTWSFSQKFTVEFQSLRSDLESQIQVAKTNGPPSSDTLQQLSLSLAKLVKLLADGTGSLPSYDQKTYENQVKILEDSIEALISSAPKPKFSFRRKGVAAPSPSIPVETTSADSPAPSPAPANSITLSNLAHQYLSLSSLSISSSPADLAFSDLQGCIIDLLPVKNNIDSPSERLELTALHARDLKNCVLLLPILQGSALLHNLRNCTVILGSHQFRMHTSENVDVFLDTSSNPVIEDCRAIRFASYPENWTSTPSARAKHQETFTVQDFSHIRSTPSPNYSWLSAVEQERILANVASGRMSGEAIDTSSMIPS